MQYDFAGVFRRSHAELQKQLGNPFVAFDTTSQMLPSGFYGLAKDETFSNYTNRTISTDYDVSFLQTNYYVAHSGEQEVRMRIWKLEGRYIQGERIGTKIYTTSLAAQAQLIVAGGNVFAI